jgi:nicotinate-nucleotide adenylyltransferase
VKAIVGGIFDPPHNGHVALAKAALERFDPDELVVLVAAAPGHRSCVEKADSRLQLAEAAFEELSRTRVLLDEHAYTVDAVRGGRFGDALFVVGADEGAAFPTWKDPDGVLEWVRLAVGTRSAYEAPDLSRYGDRVIHFDLQSPDISSTEVRRRAVEEEPLDGLVPPSVIARIREGGLYRGYT